jgi:hypothetical protein
MVVVCYLKYVAKHVLRDAEAFSTVQVVTEIDQVTSQKKACSQQAGLDLFVTGVLGF